MEGMMKSFFIFTASIYLAWTGSAWAQNKPGSPSISLQFKSTPVIGGPVNGVAKFSDIHSPAQDSNAHSMNLVLRHQMRHISKDFKNGKITKIQAQTAWENLKNIRKQELGFFKQNGKKEITAGQKSQLTAALNQNSSI
jgi:hypothetical protein